MILNIKALQDIMRNDSGVNGDAQRMEQIAWILFLKIYDFYEKQWKTEAMLGGKSYVSIIPSELSWEAWAKSTNEKGQTLGNVLTSDALLDFVNNKLFPTLKNLNITQYTPLHQAIVKHVFEDTNNYMKDGILLRRVIDEIDKISIKTKDDKKGLSQIYETFLKTLQSAGNAGEFYTPRAVTDFVISYLDPKIGDKIADLACGTGGFLTSAYHHLESKIITAQDREEASSNFYGIEKKQLPYILAVAGFLINGMEKPNLAHDNALNTPYNDLDSKEKFDIIAMNPPYGGAETSQIQNNFPLQYKSSETADLFMAIILERLKERGKAAVVLPDGFLFGNDSAKINLKKRLLDEFHLELVLRLPASVFAPYTSITTNILFFTKLDSGHLDRCFASAQHDEKGAQHDENKTAQDDGGAAQHDEKSAQHDGLDVSPVAQHDEKKRHTEPTSRHTERSEVSNKNVILSNSEISKNIESKKAESNNVKKTWFYRLDMPENIKSFGKTKSMKLEHFAPFEQWNANRQEIADENGNFKAKAYTKEELESRNYNFDLCGFVSEEEEILEPFELIKQIKTQRENLNHTLDSIMEQIADIIKENE